MWRAHSCARTYARMPLNGGPEARVLDKPDGRVRFNALRGERFEESNIMLVKNLR